MGNYQICCKLMKFLNTIKCKAHSIASHKIKSFSRYYLGKFLSRKLLQSLVLICSPTVLPTVFFFNMENYSSTVVHPVFHASVSSSRLIKLGCFLFTNFCSVMLMPAFADRRMYLCGCLSMKGHKFSLPHKLLPF